MNIRADLLSRGNPHLGEWRLHPEVVQEIWCKYGQARVDLFASEENTHCPLLFSLKGMDVSLGMDALAHPWPETVICFPTNKPYPPHTVQNQITEGEGPPNSPVMAREDMDSRDRSTAVFASVASSSAQRSPLSGRGEDCSSTSGEVESLGLTRERSNLYALGLPQNVISTIQSAWADSTRSLYEAKWKRFETWCHERQNNHFFHQCQTSLPSFRRC